MSGNLTVKITQAHVVNPNVGLSLDQTRLQIERQQTLATVVERAPAGTVTLQGGQTLLARAVPSAEGLVTITFNGAYNAALVKGDSVVTIFGGIVVGLGQSFETINRNLRSLPATINYQPDGLLGSIVYNTVAGTIHKQFGYAQGVLTTITLSGDVPGGVSLVKHLSYDAGRLTEITYS